ncbi:MAG: type II CAAX endopeptidase family protein [Planctomycetota bacterium]
MNSRPDIKDALKIFAIFLLLSLAVNMLIGSFIKTPPRTALEFLYVIFFSHILGVLVPVGVYIYSKGYNFTETLNLRPVSLPVLLGISFISIGFFLTLNIFQGLIEPLLEPYEEGMAAYQEFLVTLVLASKSPVDVFLLLLCIGIIPAVAEEVLFRGIILSGLKNSSTAARAIVLSGLLFGIIHIFPPQVVSVSILGMFFGLLVVKTNSIVTAIWCHFLNNALIILMLLIGAPPRT